MIEKSQQLRGQQNKGQHNRQSISDSSLSIDSKKQQVKNQKVTQKSTQRNSSQRSRSRKKRRSRSKETKKKHKSTHKSHKHRGSSSDSDRSRSHKRKRSKDRKKKEHDRGRERPKYRPKNNHRQYRDYKNNYQNDQIGSSIATQIPMPILFGDRRKRQRSRSPLDYYRRNQNNNDGQFWDAFSWVPRINYTPNVSSSALANTKKMRRLMITKIPFEIGITQDNLRDLITRFMAKNYLKDQMNNCPVVNLQINQTDHTVAVELSSVQQTCRICRMEKIELFKGFSNGIVRLGDSMYGNSILTQAQTAGQAQAAAFAAINVLQNKKTNFTIDSKDSPQSYTVIRVTNAVTPYMAAHLATQQWDDYKQDLIEGFSQYGKIVHSWFVTDSEKNICADAGNLFLEYQYKENAEAAMSEMQGRLYDERIIKLYYWPRDLYYLNFQPDITPPVLPPPLKTTKTK